MSTKSTPKSTLRRNGKTFGLGCPTDDDHEKFRLLLEKTKRLYSELSPGVTFTNFEIAKIAITNLATSASKTNSKRRSDISVADLQTRETKAVCHNCG